MRVDVDDVVSPSCDMSVVDMDRVGFGFFRMDAPGTDIEPARGLEGMGWVASFVLVGLCTEVNVDLAPVVVESSEGERFESVLGVMPTTKKV